MKATICPTCIVPAITLRPPNQITAETPRLTVIIIRGQPIETVRIALTARARRSSLAAPKRAFSCSARTKALTTRTPISDSCITVLSRSTLPCTWRNKGNARETRFQIMANTIGTSTRKSTERRGDVVTAMTMLPINVMGPRIIMRSIIPIMFCICVTSLVRRVTRLPVSRSSMFEKERLCTLRKSADRRSAPYPSEAITAKTPQVIPPSAPMTATPIILSPVLSTTCILPVAMPSSMIVWISRGCIRSIMTSTTISRGARSAQCQ